MNSGMHRCNTTHTKDLKGMLFVVLLLVLQFKSKANVLKGE